MAKAQVAFAKPLAALTESADVRLADIGHVVRPASRPIEQVRTTEGMAERAAELPTARLVYLCRHKLEVELDGLAQIDRQASPVGDLLNVQLASAMHQPCSVDRSRQQH